MVPPPELNPSASSQKRKTPGSERGQRQGRASVKRTDQRANRQTSVPPREGCHTSINRPSPRQRKYSGSETHAQNTHTENMTWDSCKLIRKRQEPLKHWAVLRESSDRLAQSLCPAELPPVLSSPEPVGPSGKTRRRAALPWGLCTWPNPGPAPWGSFGKHPLASVPLTGSPGSAPNSTPGSKDG